MARAALAAPWSRLLPTAGANVVIADLRLEDASGRQLEIGECGCRRVVAVQTDVTNREDIDELRDETFVCSARSMYWLIAPAGIVCFPFSRRHPTFGRRC